MNENHIAQRNQDSGSLLNKETAEGYNNQQSFSGTLNLKGGNRIAQGWGMHCLDRNISGNNRIEGAVTYTCPMHHEVNSDKPGKCPKCGMKLV